MRSVRKECLKHKRLYAIVCSVAVVAAVLISLLTPSEYICQTKLVAESSPMDLLIGMKPIDFVKKDISGSNSGALDNPEIYYDIVTSQMFRDNMAKVKVSPSDKSYTTDFYHYLTQHTHKAPWTTVSDAISRFFAGETERNWVDIQIADAVKCEFQSKQEVITLQVSAQDAYIAAALTDSAAHHLQSFLTRYRVNKAKSDLSNSKKARHSAGVDYHNALVAYSTFSDSHAGDNNTSTQTMLKSLEDEVNRTWDLYNQAAKDCQRDAYKVQQMSPAITVIQNATVPIHPSSPRYLVTIFLFLFISFFSVTGWILFRCSRASGEKQSLGDLFSPWSLSIGIWALIVIMLQIFGYLLNTLQSQFYTSLLIWLPILVFVSYFTFNLLPSKTSDARNDIAVNDIFFNFLYILSLICTPLYFYQIYKVITMFSSENIFSDLRMLAVSDETSSPLHHFYFVNQALFIIAMWKFPRINKLKFISIIAINLLCAISIMEKGSLFFMIIIALFVLYEKRYIKMRSILFTGIGILFIFFMFNIVRSEDFTANKSEEHSLTDFILMYILSPPVAFETIHQSLSLQFGSNTLSYFYDILNRFGGDYVIKTKLQDFVFVPIATNVYTVFQPFYEDFGYYGIAFFAAFYGLLSGWLYRLSCNGSIIGRCMYAYVAEVLILQFYQENLIQSIIVLVDYIIVFALCLQTKYGLALHRFSNKKTTV